MCPRRYHLARHFPSFALELPPLVPLHLVAQLDADGRATAGVSCAVTTRCAHHAVLTGRLGRRAGQATAPIRPEALGRF
jgi:hypothetical protein